MAKIGHTHYDSDRPLYVYINIQPAELSILTHNALIVCLVFA